MNYVKDHIPKDTPHDRRPSTRMDAEFLTVHNTANPKSTARNERAWLANQNNNRTASFHIVIDEREAIECLPLNEVGYHAGDGHGNGNMKSIGIEICESGDYEKTLDNTTTLVAKMLKERKWGVDRLKRHFDWSGKVCPRLMYDGGKWTGWERFKDDVARKMKGDEEMDKVIANNIIKHLKVAYAHTFIEADKKEIGQLADYLRMLSHQPKQNS